MTSWSDLFEHARSRHGVITLGDAQRAGVTARSLQRRAQVDGWPQITDRAWLAPGVKVTLQSRAAAHLALLGEPTAVSHDCAAYMHGLLRPAPTLLEVTIPWAQRRLPREGVRMHRSRTLTQDHLEEIDAIRVTKVARTIRDLAARSTWNRVYDLATDAEQRGRVTLTDLREVANRLHHGPGSGIFRSVVSQRESDRSDSALERDTRDATRDAGFAPSDGPFPIRVAGGDRLMLDVAFPDVWFALECDGFGFHRDRASFERDRERWRLAQEAGWTLGWVTRRRFRDDLGGILREVARAHELADPSRLPAQPA